jgi:hypothetical protein
MNTDAKKIESFKRGLSTKLMKTLANSKCETLNEFVSDAPNQENQNNLHTVAKGHKRALEADSSQQKTPMATRLQYRPPPPKFKPPQKKTQPNQSHKVYRKAFSIALPKGSLGQGSLGGSNNNQPCFNCNQLGHWANECPYPKKGNNQNQGNQRLVNTKARPGYVDYMTLEEIPTREVVTAGMFLVNQHPATILFDSGASHSFMSQTFASKHDQKIFVVDKDDYCISSAGASISANQIVKDILISIRDRKYTMDLIVLPGLGIDVILEMN